MSFNCTTEHYDTLYARWLDRPGTLLDLVDYDGNREGLLDLCGGTGAVAYEALRRYPDAYVALLDLNPRAQKNNEQINDNEILQFRGTAEECDKILEYKVGDRTYVTPWKYSYVIMRQALGYVDLRKTFRSVAKIIEPKIGRFAFNAFRQPKCSLNRYTREGTTFTEMSGYAGKIVFHLQMRGKGIPTPWNRDSWDISVCQWHTEQEIECALAMARFNWSKTSDRGSVRYVCWIE